MTDGTAGGGVISKEIKTIFQRVGEIIDENQISTDYIPKPDAYCPTVQLSQFEQ